MEETQTLQRLDQQWIELLSILWHIEEEQCEGEPMVVLIIEKYVVKPGKHGDFQRLWQRILKFNKEKPKMVKELKSIKLYTQTFGGINGAYCELLEFGSLAGYENFMAKVMKDKEMRKVHEDFMQLIDPTTYTMEVLNASE